MTAELTCQLCWVNQAPTKPGSIRECQGCRANTVGGVSLSSAPASFTEFTPRETPPDLVDVPDSPRVEAVHRRLVRQREKDGARSVEQWHRARGL